MYNKCPLCHIILWFHLVSLFCRSCCGPKWISSKLHNRWCTWANSIQLNSFDWMLAAHLTLPLPMVLSKWQFLNQPTLPKNLLTCHQVTHPPILTRVYRVRIPFWQGFTEYESHFGKGLQSTNPNLAMVYRSRNPILARVYRVWIPFWQGFTGYESHFGNGLQE